MNGPLENKAHYNPCLIGRKPWLARLGNALAGFFIKFFEEPTGGCPCCMAVRVLVLSAASGAAGFFAGWLL